MSDFDIVGFVDQLQSKTATPLVNSAGVLQTVTPTATQTPQVNAPAPAAAFDIVAFVDQQSGRRPPPSPRPAPEPLAFEPTPQEELSTIQKLPVAFLQRKQGLKLEQRLALAQGVQDREAILGEYRQYQRGYQDLGGNWFVGAAAMLPDLIQGVGGRLAGTVVGTGVGLGAAALINLIPGLIAVPEELGTVPTFTAAGATLGGKIGGLIGGASPMYLQGKGQIYADMREKGMTDETANMISAIGAGPYAAIEFLNIYLPGSKIFGKAGSAGAKRMIQDVIAETIQKQARKVAPDVAANIGGRILTGGLLESSEEFVQELNNALWSNLGALIDKNPDASTPMKAILGQSINAMKQAFGPSLLLGTVGGVVEGRRETKATLTDEQRRSELEKDYTPEQTTEIIEAKTTEEKLLIIDRINTEVTGDQADIQAGAEVLPPAPAQAEAEPAGVVTPEAEAATGALADRLNRPGEVTAVAVDPSPETEATEAAAEVLGFESVVWVDNQSDLPFGATTDQGTLFVSTSANRPGVSVALHEAVEQILVDAPEDFQALADLVEATANDVATGERLAKIRANVAALREDAPTELTVQILQEFSADPAFWDELTAKASADPATATKMRAIIQRIIDFIDEFLVKIQAIDPGREGSERLKAFFSEGDLPKVRTALVNALQKTQEQPAPAPAPVVTPKEVSAPTPEAPTPSEAVQEADKATIEIPDLIAASKRSGKSPTAEAIEFGIQNRDTEGIREALTAKRKKLLAEVQVLTAANDLDQAMVVATQAQLAREALESVEESSRPEKATQAAAQVEDETAPRSEEPAPAVPSPTAVPTTPEGGEPFTAFNADNTPSQLQKLNYVQLLDAAGRATFEDGTTVLDHFPTERPLMSELLSAMEAHRREAMKALGLEERTVTPLKPGEPRKQPVAPTADDRRAQEDFEESLELEVSEGTMTAEAAIKQMDKGALRPIDAKRFSEKMSTFGKTPENPRPVESSFGYRDQEDGRVYAMGPNAEEVRMPKKSRFSKEFDRREKGKVKPPDPDLPFMALEGDDLESEILKSMRRTSNVKRPPGAEAVSTARGYPRALQHLKTVATSELTYAPVRKRIETRLSDDPNASQPGYSMERLLAFSRDWIDQQGSIYDAYNAIGTEAYSSLNINERVGILGTLEQFLAATGFETGDESFFDLSDQLSARAAEAGVELGRGVKAFDMWRAMAPNNAAEAVIFARRQVKLGLQGAFKKKGRDDIMALTKQVTSEVDSAALRKAVDKAANLETKVGELKKQLQDQREEAQKTVRGWAESRRNVFKRKDVPTEEYAARAAAKRDEALAFFKGEGDQRFMALESGNAASQMYNRLVLIAESRMVDALRAGTDMGSTISAITEELKTLSPENSSMFGRIIDQAGKGIDVTLDATAAAPKKKITKKPPPDPTTGSNTDPGEWLQGVLNSTSAELDEILIEIDGLREEAKIKTKAEAQKKAMERLRKLAEKEGITLAEAQAIFYQRAKESGREALYSWAADKADPIEVQERIENNSLLNWGRVNGMPRAELNLALEKPNPLGELAAWAKENDIVAAETIPFADNYTSLEAGLTAASLKGKEPPAKQARTEAEERLAKIRSQGRIAFELQQMSKEKTGKQQALKTILQEIIRQPFQYGSTIVSQLQTRIIDQGWPENDAKRLAKEIAETYAGLIDTTLRKTLVRRFIAEDTKRGSEDLVAIEQLVKAARTKLLSDSDFLQAFSDAYKLKTIGKAEQAEIVRLGDVIEKLATDTGDPASDLVRDAQEDLNQYLYSIMPSNFKDLVMTFRKQFMLSGFTTTVQNLVSTNIQTAINIEVMMVKELIQGNYANVGIIMRGAAMPLRGEAGREFWRIAKEKKQVWKSGHKMDHGLRIDPTQFHPLFTKGGYYNPLHWFLHVFAWMQAQDYPFYLMGEGAAAALQTAKEIQADPKLKGVNLHRAVARKMGWGQEFAKFELQAKNEGLTGKQALQRSYELRRKSWSIEARLAGVAAGNIGTFNVAGVPGILGNWSRAIQNLKGTPGLGGIIVDVLLPFVNIPFMVSNAVIANSPAGFYRVVHKGPTVDPVTGNLRDVTADERLGWAIQASQASILMLAGMFYFLGEWKRWKEEDEKEDLPPIRITAHGPADSGKRAQWLAAGNEPYSITVLGKTISYRAWSSLLGVLGPMGAMQDGLLFGERDDPTKQKGFAYRVAMSSLLALPQAIIDQTSLMQLSDLLDALGSARSRGPEQAQSKMNSMIARTATSFFSPNLFKQLENIWDPSIYPNDTLAAAFLQNIPFAASGRLNKRLNLFGEPILLSALRQFNALPIARRPFNVDPVAAWLIANDIAMGPPTKKKVERDPRTGRRIERSLDDEEKYRFMLVWGPAMKRELSRKIDSGRYRNRTKEYIERDIRRMRRRVLQRTWYRFQLAEDAR